MATSARTSRRRWPTGSLIHATALIRGMFHQPSGRPQPGSGVLPPEWLDLPALPAAVRKVINTSDWAESALRYGEPMGDSGLRTVLAHKLADMGMACSEAQIITTAGATHALDIVSRTLLKAGDPVMVEEARLVGGIRPAGRAGHAGAAGAPARRRPRSGGDGALLRSTCAAAFS